MTSFSPECWVAQHAPNPGVSYTVTLWRVDAVPVDQFDRWNRECLGLRKDLREAAESGNTKQAQLIADKLNSLNTNFSNHILSLRARAGRELTGGNDLRAVLQADKGVLGYELGNAAVWVLLQLTDERGVEQHIENWRTEAPEALGDVESILQSCSAQQADQWQQDHRAKGQKVFASEEAAQATLFRHTTVLGREATDALLPTEGKVILDATLGGGGHSELLLQCGAIVWGIDRDPTACAAARKRLEAYGSHMHVLTGCFGDARELLHNEGVGSVDGIVADLGISSPQVDTPQRGFSFLTEGPLDMRMDPQSPRCAADIINDATETEIADILHLYGEERAARAIAHRIVQQRAISPITTTTRLADIICSVLPRRSKQHPATRSFQALRIAVNDELGQLEILLKEGFSLLRSGGRFAVITFHSLEDRTVKRFFERVSKPELDRPEWPGPRPNPDYAARVITRKPITPGAEELSSNPRSRSAKLRVLEKI